MGSAPVIPASERGHLPELDGLRGIAILLVMLTHAIALPLEPVATALDSVVHDVTRFGWTGVDLFFVLSGFLITGILLDTRDEQRRWRFFVRRGLRIFPLYYGVLFVLFVVFPLALNFDDPQYVTLREHQGWYWAYAVNFLQVFSHNQATTFNTIHFWSLSIEEQFYLFWPFVVWACRPRTLLRLIAVLAIAGLAARIWFVIGDPLNDAGASYVFTPVRLDGLMMGAVLAVAARSRAGLAAWRTLALRTAPAGFAAVSLLALARGGMEYTDPVISTIGFPLIALSFGALLVLALTAPAGSGFASTLRSRFLRSWGKYSYGIYVFHYMIIGAFGWFLPFYSRPAEWLGGSKVPAVLLFAVVVSAISWGTAWLSFNLYEKRFLALKRYFEKEPVRPGRLDLGREAVELAPRPAPYRGEPSSQET